MFDTENGFPKVPLIKAETCCDWMKKLHFKQHSCVHITVQQFNTANKSKDTVHKMQKN